MCGKGSNSGGGQGALGWGGLAPAQQTTTQASPQALSWYNQAMGLASQAAAKPYQQFGTTPEQFVAQLNPQQQAAQQGIAEQAAATLPYSEMGAGMQAAAGMGNAAQMAGAYMNPFMQQVVSPVQQALQQQQGQQLAQQQADAISGGAFGGERAGLQRATLQGQQELAMGQALSPLYQTGYCLKQDWPHNRLPLAREHLASRRSRRELTLSTISFSSSKCGHTCRRSFLADLLDHLDPLLALRHIRRRRLTHLVCFSPVVALPSHAWVAQ